MDVIKTKKQNPWKYSPRTFISAAVVVVVLLFLLLISSRGDHKLDRSKVLLGTVQRGELKIIVDGYGVLRSQKQTLITIPTSATVQEVVLRPGAQVNEDSVILRLSNPELLQQVEAASIALTQENASYRRLALNNQREILTEESALVEIESNLQSTTLRKEAEEGLVVKGVIPQITFKNTLLQQEQMQKRFDFQRQRVEQLKKVIKESEMIQKKQVEQAAANYQTMQQRADKLTVRAGIKGELQRLPVVLGQSVSAGQELALVGSDQDLTALIRVSQSKAQQLRIGQNAEINTHHEVVPGQVTRIAPEVHQGTIEVEIAFAQGVPATARPELNVDARIFTETIKDALYIERPVNVQDNSSSNLFKFDEHKNVAEQQQITFGGESGKYIQILRGANEKENFILSDMTQFNDVSKVRVLN